MEDYENEKRMVKIIELWEEDLRNESLNIFWEWIKCGKFNRRIFKKLILKFIKENEDGRI